MLSQLLFIRFRTAEKALREGRLDEAFRLAMAPDLRNHRRGQTVLAALAEKFLERARDHYRADRFSEALLDLDRAQPGLPFADGKLGDQVAELCKFVQTVAAETNRDHSSRRRRLEEAVRRIEDGSLAAGQRMLEEAGSADPAARRAREAAERNAAQVAEWVAQAERHLASGQFASAADRIRRARTLDTHSPEVIRIESELCNRVFAGARQALIDGKLNVAAQEIASLSDLGRKLPARREISDALALAREAGSHLRGGRYAEARRCAMSLMRLLPRAKWLETAGEQIRKMDELHTSLMAGPLGDLAGTAGGTIVPSPPDTAPPPVSLGETIAVSRTPQIPARPVARPAEKLLLLVDGGGSFLLLRGPAASIGRAAAEHPADIPLFSDIAERHVNVSRVEDDYFAFANRNIEVAGTPTQHTLLRDGDRVVLGRKAKFMFRLPSRRTATAVIELSDTTKMPNDVRRVLLFDRAATIGFGPAAHIPCRHAGGPLILFERNGGLWVRRQGDGHVDTESKELRIGETVEIGGVSMVIRPWTMKTQ